MQDKTKIELRRKNSLNHGSAQYIDHLTLFRSIRLIQEIYPKLQLLWASSKVKLYSFPTVRIMTKIQDHSSYGNLVDLKGLIILENL